MISKISGIFLPVFIFSTLLVNITGAQSEAPRSVSLERVIERLIDQATDLKKGLAGLKNLSEEQDGLRQGYLEFLDKAIEYYQSLDVDPDGSNVKLLASELINKRESDFGEQIKKAVDFLLTFQTKSVLKVAETRFLRIKNDLGRLINLKVLKRERVEFLLNEAHLLLVSAAELIDQADSKEADSRELLSEAIADIKLAYKKFLEIANLLKEALK